jgi:histidine ammonia-lyase
VTVSVGDDLTFDDVVGVAHGDSVDIAPHVEEAMAPARRVVEEAVASGRAVYGISTGIGDLANVRIDPSDAARVQRDLVRSHATAVGPPLGNEVVRAMILLKARTLAAGNSGVRYELVERLVDLLKHGIVPVVPSQGSLGASGDLSPLAHLALPLLGEGEVTYRGKRTPAAEALDAEELTPVELSYKEGLALINGTEMMLAIGILTWVGGRRLARTADLVAAMTLEACLGTDRAFDEELLALRSHAGAQVVGATLRAALAGSEIVASHRESEHLVQDAYSLRCIPQVHGAYRDGLDYVRTMLERELASVIDNPSVLPHRNEVLSSGNFHGEALALALDHLCLCLAGYATISERRTARLVDPDLNNGLPAFLTPDPGRRSGFMLTQYTAAALVAENRTLCFPASSDSMSTSAGQEDHVSMGATAARKAAAVLVNSERALAIEALCAAQGQDLRAPLEPSPVTGALRAAVRRVSAPLDEDRPLSREIEAVATLLAKGTLEAVADGSGPGPAA